ncbi:MAG: hypothetical protein NVSMB4_11480 [Acidimicrobiales bacterium]
MSVAKLSASAFRRETPQLADHLGAVLAHPAGPTGGLPLALAEGRPADRCDALRTLLGIYDLALAPLEDVGRAVDWQHEPAVGVLRHALEQDFEATLDRWSEPFMANLSADWQTDPVPAVRALATIDRVPAVYEWLAEHATWDEFVCFASLEGGPDDSFDDLVAMCQIGLPPEAKMELARNYWDELGNGHPGAVHRELHRRLSEAIGIEIIPRARLDEPALARAALGGFLATNRRLQPEMIGALGMIELQAGPRCRRVVRALERLEGPSDATPFYEEHAVADPRHGKDWLDNAIGSLAERGWGPGIVRGAAWRIAVNRRFFAALGAQVGASSALA